MTKQDKALIRKLHNHKGGPIELTQAECWCMAEVLGRLLERLNDMTLALKIVEAGIWRDKKTNTCGLAGAAVAVHAVEEALGKKRR